MRPLRAQTRVGREVLDRVGVVTQPSLTADTSAHRLATRRRFGLTEREWARNADDILRRRTTLRLHGLVDAELARRVEQAIGRGAESRPATVR